VNRGTPGGPRDLRVTDVLSIAGLQKQYHGLRPLRMQSLVIAAGERVAVSGLDAGAAEVLVNLVTGASLPDAGDVRVLGRSTADISDGDQWLASLDRFGIVSPRGVLLEGSTVEQNLAMPFSLEIDPVPPEIAARVASLARACGIDESWLRRTAGGMPAEMRARVHLARAIALEPSLLILEHPTAGLPADTLERYGADVAAVADARRLAVLVLTQDEEFARRVAVRALRLQPASGALKPIKRGWFR
jgi:ABC-type transporter Mla maintaining outer membrane lipid asymmetry ATPase subunit MlaF